MNLPETEMALPPDAWVTVPVDGTPAPFSATARALVEVSVSNASLFLDRLRLRESVGEHVRINGPGPVAGVLRLVEVDESTDTAVLQIEAEADTGPQPT